MTAKVKVPYPTEETIAWFVKNIGPRTHYTTYSIGGKGWKFEFKRYDPYEREWLLTVDDEKYLSYYLLVK